MPKWFAFGELSLNLIYIGLTPIFWLITANIGIYLYFKDYTSKTDTLKQHPFIFTFFTMLGISLAGIVPAILSCLNKNKNQKTDTLPLYQLANPHNMLIIQNKPRYQVIVHLLMLLCGTLELAQTALSALFNSDFAGVFLFFNLKFIQTFMVILFCKVFLKYAFYRHQLFSALVIVIGTVIVLIEIMVCLELSPNTLYSSLAYVVIYLILAIKDVIEKWLMEFRNTDPYKLLFYEGIYGLIVNCILFIPLSYIKCQEWRICAHGEKAPDLTPPYYMENVFRAFKVLFEKADVGALLCTYSVFTTFHYVFGMLVNKYYTPIHKSISDIVSSFFNWLMQIKNVKKSTSTLKLISVIGYIILLVGSLVFNEIIICYFWGFEVNTKREITQRSQKDVQALTENSLMDFIALDKNAED